MREAVCALVMGGEASSWRWDRAAVMAWGEGPER